MKDERRNPILCRKDRATAVAVGVARVLGSSEFYCGLLLLLAVETIGFVSVGNLLFACTAVGDEPAADLYGLAMRG